MNIVKLESDKYGKFKGVTLSYDLNALFKVSKMDISKMATENPVKLLSEFVKLGLNKYHPDIAGNDEEVENLLVVLIQIFGVQKLTENLIKSVQFSIQGDGDPNNDTIFTITQQ